MIADGEVELREVLGPADLSSGKELRGSEVFQVLVVGEYVDWIACAFKVLSPVTEGFKDG